MTVRVGVRHRNGKINHIDVNGTSDWAEARAFVLSQVPTARVVLAMICGGSGRQAAPTEKAAA